METKKTNTTQRTIFIGNNGKKEAISIFLNKEQLSKITQASKNDNLFFSHFCTKIIHKFFNYSDPYNNLVKYAEYNGFKVSNAARHIILNEIDKANK